MKIDRCQCFGVPFAELKETALATGAASIAELQEHAEFGLRCRLCHPYIRRMLRTGEVVFGSILTEHDVPDRA
jgi:bacterioferritin-associated ferredoxin